jgi:hypothetical protein
METFRQIVTVSSNRKIEMTLPDAIPPGQVEIVVVVQPINEPAPSASAPAADNLFGFLPKRVDPLQFERQMRDEWNR